MSKNLSPSKDFVDLYRVLQVHRFYNELDNAIVFIPLGNGKYRVIARCMNKKLLTSKTMRENLLSSLNRVQKIQFYCGFIIAQFQRLQFTKLGKFCKIILFSPVCVFLLKVLVYMFISAVLTPCAIFVNKWLPGQNKTNPVG